MSGHKRLLELRFTSDPKRLKMVRDQVQRAAGQLECTKQLVSDLIIAVNEACMNIMEHAYKGDRSGEIVLEINDNGGEIEVVLTDFADPVNFEDIQHRDLDDVRPGGLGTFFITEIMDECAYAHLQGHSGNVLRMTKRLSSQSGTRGNL
jgi:anti-sigma regulatory factor (Ser/Thr protein kinase)